MKKVVKTPGNISFEHGKRRQPSKRQWLFVLAVLSAVALLVSATAPGLAMLLLFLALASGASYIKRFVQSAPVDFEFLSFGSAYLAAFHGVGLALALAFFGTLLSEVILGGIREFSWVKVVSVAITAVAAAIFGTGAAALFIAVLIGLIVQYMLMVMLTQDAVLNFLRRLTNAAFQAYLIFFLLPLFNS